MTALQYRGTACDVQEARTALEPGEHSACLNRCSRAPASPCCAWFSGSTWTRIDDWLEPEL